MKPAPLKLALFIILFCQLFAPSVYAGDTLNHVLNKALSRLDSGKITSGILYDRVLPLSRVEAHSGSEASSPANLRQWKQMYDEMHRASLDKPRWPNLETFVAQAQERMRTGDIPIVLMNFNYQRIRADALELGMLTIEGDHLVERGDNLYVENRLFAMTSLKERTYRGGNVSFVISPEAYVTNDARTPRSIMIDFDDGTGFRSVAFGERRFVRYAETGRKSIRARVTLSDGSVCHAGFYFNVANLAAPVPNDTIPITASISYNSEFGTGEAYVYLADTHTSVTNPIVVIEGFDLDNTLNWDEIYDLLNEENLLEDLRANGYDAVVLNFSDATDYMQKNSFVVLELLQQVDAMIAPQVGYVLVGASMGGLCARYALSYMETNALPHRVRTFISFDVPHKGANIPLGIQYWLDFFSGQSVDAAFLLSRLDTPASRQMLVYHHTDPAGATGESDPLRSVFDADLLALGDYPTIPRNVAIANGSGSMSNQGFNPGDQIIEWEYNTLFVDITGNVWAVPDGINTTIFDGLISIIFILNDTQTVTVSGTSPYDNAPGGARNSMAQMDSTEAPYGDIVALYDDHCFIPTISALDLATSDVFYDIAGDPSLLSMTPFDAVYYPTTNQDHVDITAENAAWIKSEIYSTPTAITPHSVVVRNRLHQNYPNPFNPTTRIRFELHHPTHVSLSIYDVQGHLVNTLVDRPILVGPAAYDWNGRDSGGNPVGSGVYFYRLVTDTGTQTRKMVLIK